MIQKSTYKKVTWIDLENPTQAEARQLIDECSIPPIIANELLSPTLRPKVDVHDDFIYLILHFPTMRTTPNGEYRQTQEIDFVIGKDFIITTHYDAVDALHDFSRVFEVNSILDKSNMGEHAGFVFFYMIRSFYKQMLDHVEGIRDQLHDIEQEIFSGNERAMVVEISRLNRILLTFKESMFAHKEVLESFESVGGSFFGGQFTHHLQSIVGEYYKVASAIEGSKEYVKELRETNDSLLYAKQNEIMKILTIMAFVTFPLSLIAGIFGMNTEYMPIVGLPYDFFIISFGMLILTLLMFIYFKSKRWL